MARRDEHDDRPYPPTPLRLADARRRGQVARSADLAGVLTAGGGVLLLCLGAIGAAFSVGFMAQNAALGIAAAVPSFLLIGLGIGAAGTNLLALLACRVDDGRQAAAGSLVWIMMIFGLAATGITAGQLLDPYSHGRLVSVTLGFSAVAMTLTVIGIWGQERGEKRHVEKREGDFREVLRELWIDPRVRLE